MKIDSANTVDPKIIRSETDNNTSDKDDERLKEACSDFEGVLLGYMLKSMQNTLSGDALFGGGLQKDMYDSMYNQELAEHISEGEHSLGIGDALYRQLKVKTGMDDA